MTLRAVIIDDEPLARRGIRARLRRAGDVEVVGECASGREGIAAIRELTPDVVFLDVQMPGVDGFGVVQHVGAERMPTTVFVTAYDAHALRAFEAHALDYLLKPIDDDRFAHALERVRRRVAEHRESAVARRLVALLEGVETGETRRSAEQADAADQSANVLRDGRLLVRDQGRVVVVDVTDIDWIEAEGDYVRLHVAGRSHRLRETMAGVERALDPSRFARVHRSTIVNTARIRELRPCSSREYDVILHDGTRLKLSRRFRGRLNL
jgi:two-component system, LytTR family, response regulator